MNIIRLSLLFLCISALYHHKNYGWYQSTIKLNRYHQYLEDGTNEGQDWSYFNKIPKSRYHTFCKAFQEFEKINGNIIVELGTTRSFVHGGLPGCNNDDSKYWTPQDPTRWDWGAGCFTRMAAECLCHTNPTIHTIDITAAHINRCKVITKDYENIIQYHIMSSEQFLRMCQFNIDLLYLDTGDMTPIESSAQLHLREAKIIVERDLVKHGGLILIDDVRHSTPKKFGEKSDYGKAKYSLTYFLEHGFEIIEDEFQVLLRKK